MTTAKEEGTDSSNGDDQDMEHDDNAEGEGETTKNTELSEHS